MFTKTVKYISRKWRVSLDSADISYYLTCMNSCMVMNSSFTKPWKGVGSRSGWCQSITTFRGVTVLLVLFILSFPVSADGIEGVVTDITGSPSPPVRYWKPALNEVNSSLNFSSMDVKQQVPARKDPKLLVLLYHNIVYGRTGNTYNRDLYNFEHDLAYIKRNFRITNFDDALNGADRMSPDRAIITFDDGDLSIYAIVYPLFRRYGIEATFFIVPSFIGTVGYMNWDQVREIGSYRTSDGKQLFQFGSHSLTHRPLGELSLPEIRRELNESKRIIEEQTGEPVRVLALPFGSGAGDPFITQAAMEAGYTAIRTSKSEAQFMKNIDPWEIGAMNVENYSSDVMVTKALDLMGDRR